MGIVIVVKKYMDEYLTFRKVGVRNTTNRPLNRTMVYNFLDDSKYIIKFSVLLYADEEFPLKL